MAVKKVERWLGPILNHDPFAEAAEWRVRIGDIAQERCATIEQSQL
jgi:hypothetical protein